MSLATSSDQPVTAGIAAAGAFLVGSCRNVFSAGRRSELPAVKSLLVTPQATCKMVT